MSDETRYCEACERGEKTITPPATKILGPGLPVHTPSGMLCTKHLPVWPIAKTACEPAPAPQPICSVCLGEQSVGASDEGTLAECPNCARPTHFRGGLMCKNCGQLSIHHGRYGECPTPEQYNQAVKNQQSQPAGEAPAPVTQPISKRNNISALDELVTPIYNERPAQPTAEQVERPRIVCLCGSTRFKDAFDEANYRETMAGRIVLSVGFMMHATGNRHGEDVGATPEQKIALDVLHKRKIDLADEVLILNVGGYIGESTRSELEHAMKQGKIIRYLEESEALAPWRRR